MKAITPYLLAGILLNTGPVTADVVISEEADTAVGKMTGGWAGFLLGGAVGGPIGAFVLGGLGGWSGSEIQQAVGMEGAAYRVKREDGSELVVRSPNKKWDQGDLVHVSGRRLVEADIIGSPDQLTKITSLMGKTGAE
ncbi:MAG TPA: hypothetical protein ENI05_10280 [Porticoccus sp.]|nr:hypothetical protein [Porticoccus sp.]